MRRCESVTGARSQSGKYLEKLFSRSRGNSYAKGEDEGRDVSKLCNYQAGRSHEKARAKFVSTSALVR